MARARYWYRVRWDIDVFEPSPKAAANEARRIQLDPDNQAIHFTVEKAGDVQSKKDIIADLKPKSPKSPKSPTSRH